MYSLYYLSQVFMNTDYIGIRFPHILRSNDYYFYLCWRIHSRIQIRRYTNTYGVIKFPQNIYTSYWISRFIRRCEFSFFLCTYVLLSSWIYVPYIILQLSPASPQFQIPRILDISLLPRISQKNLSAYTSWFQQISEYRHLGLEIIITDSFYLDGIQRYHF